MWSTKTLEWRIASQSFAVCRNEHVFDVQTRYPENIQYTFQEKKTQLILWHLQYLTSADLILEQKRAVILEIFALQIKKDKIELTAGLEYNYRYNCVINPAIMR